MRFPASTESHLLGLLDERFGAIGRSRSDNAAKTLVYASAPGRIELAGNHTDHQGGKTIAAAIEHRAYAIARANGTGSIRVFTDGFGSFCMGLDDLEAKDGELGTPASLIRGMVAAYSRAGGTLRGFDAVSCSDIPVGRGLSSSAAFEVLMGVLLRALCTRHDETPARCEMIFSRQELTAIALEGAQVEQAYFGKPSGSQDQLACAHGGVAAMDFSSDPPRISPIAFDAESFGYALCLIDSRCDHSAHTDEYAAVPADMQAVARLFDGITLHDVGERAFFDGFATVRERLGDRAALRALHYFEETKRAGMQQEALRSGDFAKFLSLVRESGASSAQFLQNVSARSDRTGKSQPAMVVLALCAHLLDGARTSRGAYRIHGGGFGGSVLSIVKAKEVDRFMKAMDALLGYRACIPVAISPEGASAKWVDR